MRWLTTVLVVAIAAPFAPAARAVAATGSRTPVPLHIVEIAIPPLSVAGYQSSGTFPQVSGADIPLDAVNAGLRQAVLDDQMRYSHSARQAVADNRAGGSSGVGMYETIPNRRFLSASTVVVSVLIPDEELYPYGNDGEGWISTTLIVPSGATVSLLSLFTDGSRGLQALARADAAQAWKTNPCIHTASFHNFVTARMWTHPTAGTFETFALSPSGMAVGFPNGLIGAEACGRIAVTIPYITVRPYLSKKGKALVAGVLEPRK
jgi:hypothetical protein